MLYLISRFRKEMEINVHDCYNWIDKYQTLNLVTILKCLLSIPSMRCILYQTNVLMHAWRMNSEVYLFVVMEINGLKLTMSQTSKHEDNLWWFVKTCDWCIYSCYNIALGIRNYLVHYIMHKFYYNSTWVLALEEWLLLILIFIKIQRIKHFSSDFTYDL